MNKIQNNIFKSLSLILLYGITIFSARAETVTYYVNDLSGSPIAAMDASGNRIWRESYMPYGEKRLKPSAANNDIGFTGHQNDDFLGLTYMQARYYDAILGRFYGVDPIGYRGLHSFNRYSYATNNPYRYVDPDGRDIGEIDAALRRVGKEPRQRAPLSLEGAIDAGILVATALEGPKGVLEAAVEKITGIESPLPSLKKGFKSLVSGFKKDKDKWSRDPKSIQDQMTLKSAKEGNGEVIISNLNDPKFKGMAKVEVRTKSKNKADSVVHYVRDKKGKGKDFKFKKHSTDNKKPLGNDPPVPPSG